jgi:glyoxylase I family protein
MGDVREPETADRPRRGDSVDLIIEKVTPLLEVFDLPASMAFYRDRLGFDLVAGDDSWWAMLQLGGATLMLNTAYERDERPPSPDPARVRGHADASLYFSCPDADEVYASLRERRLDVRPPVITSYGMKQVAIRDPDGFQLFFISPLGT